METLATDDIITILSFLPVNDYTKYARVCSTFGEIINSNPSIFPRPGRLRLRMTVGQRKDCRFVRNSGQLKIQDSHDRLRSFAVTILQNGGVKLLQVNDFARDMLNTCYDSGIYRRLKNEKPFSEVDVFLMWVFSKSDFDSIEFIDMGTLANKVKSALGPSRARCLMVAVPETFGNSPRPRRDAFSTFNITKFFKPIRDSQKEMDVNLKLEVVPVDNNCFPRTSGHIRLLTDYAAFFSNVIICLNRTRFFAALCALGEKWMERSLGKTKFTMVFSYMNAEPRPQDERDYFCTKFLGLSLNLVNMSEGTFSTLSNYTAFERFPEFLDCQRKVDKVSFMRLYFKKRDKNLYVTANAMKGQ